MRATRSACIGALMIAFAIILLMAPGCASEGSEEAPSPTSEAAEETEQAPQAVLESFWESPRKSGSYKVVTTDPTKDEPYTMVASFVFDGSLFRIDYEGGPTIMSADGASVVYVDHGKETTQAGQTPASYYVGLFTKPAVELEDRGVDQESGAREQ